jgi:hypothetical protein
MERGRDGERDGALGHLSDVDDEVEHDEEAEELLPPGRLEERPRRRLHIILSHITIMIIIFYNTIIKIKLLKRPQS